MENSEENEIENLEENESTTQIVKKKKILFNIGIVLIGFQFLLFYRYGIPNSLKNIHFNEINSRNYGVVLATITAPYITMIVGVLLISIYFFINREK